MAGWIIRCEGERVYDSRGRIEKAPGCQPIYWLNIHVWYRYGYTQSSAQRRQWRPTGRRAKRVSRRNRHRTENVSYFIKTLWIINSKCKGCKYIQSVFLGVHSIYISILGSQFDLSFIAWCNTSTYYSDKQRFGSYIDVVLSHLNNFKTVILHAWQQFYI